MAEFKIDSEAFKRDLERLNIGDRRPALVKVGIEALESAKELAGDLAPRDTGQLAGDFIVQEAKASDFNDVIVELGVLKRSFYLFFQEYGTAHHAPQPSIGPAMERSIDEIEDRLVTGLQKEINSRLN